MARVAVVAFLAAVVIDLERRYARGDGDRLRVRRGHVDGGVVGECRGNGDCRGGHAEGGGVAPNAPIYCHGIAAGIRHADAAEHVAALRRGGQGDHVVHLGSGCTCTADSSCDAAARGRIVYGDTRHCAGADERHRQVEAGVVGAAVRIEVERQALAAAVDGGDGGLGVAGCAAHCVEQFGAAGCAAVIDGQFVPVELHRDAARELEHVALGGGQGEGAVARVAVVAARAAVVIHLEGGDGGIAERQRVLARRGHVHVLRAVVVLQRHVVCPRCRGGEHRHEQRHGSPRDVLSCKCSFHTH
ncbi:MAG: hypothetical protein IJ888_02615 [Prevotella sp.]|nr:hypothetical protein [Prevotella sp.]